MTTLYLIRHGEVENPKQVWYGRLPGYGLSKKGRQEMVQTAQYLADKNVSSLYASPLERAQESMAIIKNELSLPEIRTAEELLELRSSFQGTPLAQLNAQGFDLFSPTKRKEPDESMEEVLTRMKKFLSDVQEKHSGENIAATSHGDPLMILKTYLEDRPLTLAAIRTGNYLGHGEVLKITLDDKNKTIESVFIPHV